MSAQNTPGIHWVVRALPDEDGRYFHFWDRDAYGEPQFGDEYGAKRYATLAGCSSRLRALRRDGYKVRGVSRNTARADAANINEAFGSAA